MKLLIASLLVLLITSSQAISASRFTSQFKLKQDVDVETPATGAEAPPAAAEAGVDDDVNPQDAVDFLGGVLFYFQGLLAELQEVRGDDDKLDEIADDAFSQFDKDDDQRISWAEFQQVVIGVAQETGVDYPEYDEVRKTFDDLDADQSGDLDWTETRAGVVVEVDHALDDVNGAIDELNKAIAGFNAEIEAQKVAEAPEQPPAAEGEEGAAAEESSSDSSDEQEVLITINKAKESVKNVNENLQKLGTLINLKTQLKSLRQ